MTWLVYRTPTGTALVQPNHVVISRHASYRERIEREELEAAGQMGLDFGGAP
ncbi:MAG: hypothetical protein RBU36_12705 [Thermoanaerobaculia bacterium]|nr:hypothetical protein [Thermoanaerobaculia bacterium]